MLGCKTFVDGKIQNPEKHKSVENGDDAKKVRDAPCVLGDKRPLISDEAPTATGWTGLGKVFLLPTTTDAKRYLCQQR